MYHFIPSVWVTCMLVIFLCQGQHTNNSHGKSAVKTGPLWCSDLNQVELSLTFLSFYAHSSPQLYSDRLILWLISIQQLSTRFWCFNSHFFKLCMNFVSEMGEMLWENWQDFSSRWIDLWQCTSSNNLAKGRYFFSLPEFSMCMDFVRRILSWSTDQMPCLGQLWCSTVLSAAGPTVLSWQRSD